MTAVLQLLVFVGAIVALVAFGFRRDRKEHQQGRDPRQEEIYFPNHDHETTHRDRGAAMSRTDLSHF